MGQPDAPYQAPRPADEGREGLRRRCLIQALGLGYVLYGQEDQLIDLETRRLQAGGLSPAELAELAELLRHHDVLSREALRAYARLRLVDAEAVAMIRTGAVPNL